MSAANVISLPTAKFASGTSKGMMADCRQIATTRLSRLITEMLDAVETEFFDMAEKSKSNEEQSLYLDARAQSREQRKSIETQFKLHFENLFDRRLNKEKLKAVVYDFESMSLVDDDQTSGDIAVTHMAQKVRGTCDDEFGMLAARIEHLMGDGDLEYSDNPLSPDVVAEALRSALSHLETGMQTRITLLHALEGHLAKAMPEVYQDLNSHLAKNQVLPDIRPGTWRVKLKPVPSKPATPSPISNTAVPGPLPSNAGNGPPAGASGKRNIFELLHRAFVQQGAGPRGYSQSTAGSQPSAELPTQSVVQSLTQIQRESQNYAGNGVVVSESWLRELKSRPGVSGATPIDTLTIDIVALLFDHLFDDKDIPSALKAQFGRLQIPVLKVALLDKTFFASKQHPARALLDRMGDLAIGVSDTGIVVDFLSKMVTQIQDEFEADIAVFARSLVALETFHSSWLAQESRVCAAGAKPILESERRETAGFIAAKTISIFIAENSASEPLAEVLNSYWQPLLADLAFAEEEESARWAQLMAIARDLQWSLAPKPNAEDRDRLVKMLPTLVRSVVSVMKDAQATTAALRGFLDYLVACHAAAVKRDEILTVPVAKPRLITESDSVPQSKPVASISNIDSATSIRANIARGTWVEFQIAGVTKRGKLTWVSPKKGIYLFTNPEHIEPVSVSPDDLADWLKQGRARVLDDKPLFERAVARALSTVQ